MDGQVRESVHVYATCEVGESESPVTEEDGPVVLLRFNRRSQTPKPFQIFFYGWAIFDPRAAVALGERLGLIAANERQLARCLHIRQQRHVDIVLIGDVIDLDARTSGDGGAQLDIRVYDHGDAAEGHVLRHKPTVPLSSGMA